MKKIITAALGITMIASLCIPVFATNTTFEATEEQSLAQAQAIAYMDVSNMDVEMQEKIFEARDKVISSESWVADGVNGRILDKDGNVKEVLPEFYELFPADWEMPEYVPEVKPMIRVNERSTRSSWVSSIFEDDVYLKVPSTSTNSPAFCTFNSAGFVGTANEYVVNTFYTWGMYQNPTVTASYNVGYSNANTGQSLGLATNLENGESFAIDPPYNVSVAIRASTYDSVGSWSMRVDGDFSHV